MMEITQEREQSANKKAKINHTPHSHQKMGFQTEVQLINNNGTEDIIFVNGFLNLNTIAHLQEQIRYKLQQSGKVMETDECEFDFLDLRITMDDI